MGRSARRPGLQVGRNGGAMRAIVLAATLAVSATVLAQQPLDRRQIPTPGKTPSLVVPSWTRLMLGNGAELLVSEKHNLPLVSFTITFLGGANQFETAERRGVASFAASMMSEGTKSRDGEALSNALQLLGTSIATNVAGESGSIGFESTTSKFAATLDILADVLVNSSFPADALERLRAQRLVQLEQARSQPGSIAGRVFPRILYGDRHPFGQATTETTVK